jgi:hypothetical protein
MTTSMHSAHLERADLGGREVTATLDRTAVERARNLGENDLVLNVARADGTLGELTMSWSPEDIDALLASASDREITIAFDRAELEEALAHEADVEAHGLRRRALVLTVVLATSVAAPTVASAHLAEGTAVSPATMVGTTVAPAVMVGGAQAAIPVTAPGQFNPATTVGGAGIQAADETYAASFNPATTVGGAQAAIPASAPGQFNPATTVGGAGIQAADETYAASFNPATTVGGAQPAIEASTPAGTPAVVVGGAIPAAADATSPALMVGGGGQNTPDQSSPAVMVGGGGAPATPTPLDPATVTPTVSASSQSFLDQNATEIAALAGGAAIAITAAGFAAATTSRRRPVRPA